MSQAWKDLERRVCHRLGGRRRHSIGPNGWAQGSDDDGNLPVAVECKRTTRYQLRKEWLTQARRNGQDTGRPWMLVIAEHNDRHPIAILDFEIVAQLLEREASCNPQSATSHSSSSPSSESSPSSTASVSKRERRG